MNVVNDLRIAARAAAKHPGTASLAMLSIALGIGTTTGVFSFADGLLLRPLAIRQPNQVLEATSVGEDGGRLLYGWADYEAMRAAVGDAAQLAAYQRRGAMLSRDEGGSDLVLISPVSSNYLRLLGIRPMLGHPSLETVDGQPSAILGWRLWQRRFGGDRSIVGKTIIVSEHPMIVAGVMPRDFGGLERGVSNDIWVSTDTWFDVLKRGARQSHADQFEIIAQLNRAADRDVIAEQLDAGIRGPDAHKPASKGVRGTMLKASFGGGWSANLKTSGALIAILALLLFVACANVALLHLAQTESRRKELAVRKALGAENSRIFQQLFTETAFLAIPGVLLGVLFARVFVSKAMQFLPEQSIVVQVDGRVLVFTAFASLFSLLVAAISPTRTAADISLSDALKAHQGTAGGASEWWRNLFMIGQIAISVVLVGAALLFATSLREMAKIEPGFDRTRKLLIVNAVPGLSLPPHEWAEQVANRLGSLPGVRTATFARRLPLGSSGGGATVSVQPPGEQPRAVRFNNVAGNYFAVMQPRLLAGRGIDANDRAGTPLVCVVSEKFARQFLPGRNPLRETILVTPAFSKEPAKSWEIVGVVADAPANDVHEEIQPYLYFSYAQMPVSDLTLVVETVTAPIGLIRTVNDEVRRFDPKALLYGMTTMEDYMNAATTSDRLLVAMATTLGFFTAALMAAGLFGALHYSVARRTRELGLRVALGATPGRIRRLVLGDALRLALWGVPAGLLLLVALGSLARAVVVGVSIMDARVWCIGAAVVVLIVLLAAWLPARRAMLLEPMEALRAD